MLVTSIAGFTCFVVVDLARQGSGLTTAKIFATMQLMGTLKFVMFFMGIAFGFYFELKIIFERICTIFNIEDKKMIEIDPKTKKLIPSTLPKKNDHATQPK